MLADNPLFKVAFHNDSVTLYMPVDISSYHKSREVHMQAQERYSKAGISKEVLAAMCSRALEMCNKTAALDNLRTDMGVLWNNILARMNEPVDELCCIRMGAIACFLPDENPDKVELAYTERKVQLAIEHPDLYTFFLNTGIAFTPAYNTLLRGLNVEDYLSSRTGDAKGIDLTDSPQDRINELFENTIQSCLIRSEGKQRDADYLMDCGYWEYYYRALQYKNYCAWHKEQMKKTNTE